MQKTPWLVEPYAACILRQLMPNYTEEGTIVATVGFENLKKTDCVKIQYSNIKGITSLEKVYLITN